MKVRTDVEYCINHTISGKIMLVGIKEINSFMKVDKNHLDAAKRFIEKYKTEDVDIKNLDEEETRFYNSFSKLGYMDNGVEAKTAFNEFKTLGKEIVKVEPSNKELFPKIDDVTKTIILIMSVVLGFIYIFRNRALIPTQIDYVHMKLWEIFLTILLFPALVMGLHEVGHCFIAKVYGVKIKSVSIGWFYICPLLLVQYFGLNLEKQYKKIAVMFGGAYFNFLLAVLGVFIKAHFGMYISDAVIGIWISAHISLIITNLGLYGMTDGYYIVSSIIGIMNIRLKGYKCLNSIVSKKGLPKQHDVKVCGAILIGLFTTSVISVYANIRYWLRLFGLPEYIFAVAFLGLLLVLVSKFILRVRKLSFS